MCIDLLLTSADTCCYLKLASLILLVLLQLLQLLLLLLQLQLLTSCYMLLLCINPEVAAAAPIFADVASDVHRQHQPKVLQRSFACLCLSSI